MLTYSYVHLHRETQVSRLGTDTFITMFTPILLATALACSDANWLAEGIQSNRDITSEVKTELIEVLTKDCVEDSDATVD